MNKNINRFSLLLGLIGTSLTFSLLIILLWILQSDVIFHGAAIALGIILPILGLGIIIFISQKKNVHGFPMVLIWFVIFLIPLIISWGTIGFTTDFGGFESAVRNVLIFAVVFAALEIITLLVYWTLQQSQPKNHRKITKTMFKIVALVVIIGNAFAYGFLYDALWRGNILGGTGHNDGPWATWQANPSNSITITWLTATKNSTTLSYGTNPNDLNLKYSNSQQVFLHKVVLTGLTPNTTYYYRIPEIFETPHASTVFHFKTAPIETDNFRFAIFGDKQPTGPDMLVTNGFVADGLINQNYDFICQLGDLASSGTNTNDWHLTLDSLARVGATTPLMMAIGNHDFAGIRGATNWRQLFSYPFAKTVGRNFYSFDYGTAHFVMMDSTELLYRITEGQLQWIEADIKDARDRGQQWVFCMLHRTLLSTATSGMNQELSHQLYPFFDRMAVDAVFYGHDHHYEHYNYTYGGNGLVYSADDTWDHHSVQYFITGGGGANLEVDYGVLSIKPYSYTEHWYNTITGSYMDKEYEHRAWNSSKYVQNPSFTINYTQYTPKGLYDGKYYYHAPALEAYTDDAIDYGYTYGEQAYHFMDIQIQGNTCTIRAVYPNGVMLSGPLDMYPQIYILKK